MCGIWAYLHRGSANAVKAVNAVKGVSLLKARGPESTYLQELPSGIWGFTRLAINGLNDNGMQPFFLLENSMYWMCNGEIYNYAILKQRHGIPPGSGSDCEIIGHMYCSVNEDGVNLARSLDGEFAFLLRDEERGVTIVARDPYGVRPLFWGEGENGLFFGSERKSIQEYVSKTYAFPPGEVWTIYDTTIVKERYHTLPWVKLPLIIDAMPLIRSALEEAVIKRVSNSERPVAALLSGGLDSSLVCAIAHRALMGMHNTPLHTFSIGLEGSTDIEYARKAANYIGSVHTEVIVTADEMFAAIPQVIHDIESYDITTVRASVGNWLVARYIRKNSDCKVVLNGDGSDEVWGSYKYFRKAPLEEFDPECRRLLGEIHLYDVLRSDRSISSHGLEPRTPFLDQQFVALAFGVQTEDRRNDKWFLRKAFAESNLLPDCVLWREKEAFSDGVSSVAKSWYQEIQERVNLTGWEEDAKRFTPVPHTAEAYWYRTIFEAKYPNVGDLWPYWMPRWSPETTDPSARTLV
jgi:asparagine synthase (glutamine-hydrolysing)